jgi:hypothetical protein
MAGKGGKGLLAAKTTAAKTAEKDKGKKAPVSRSSRAGLQVSPTARAPPPLSLPSRAILWCFSLDLDSHARSLAARGPVEACSRGLPTPAR